MHNDIRPVHKLPDRHPVVPPETLFRPGQVEETAFHTPEEIAAAQNLLHPLPEPAAENPSTADKSLASAADGQPVKQKRPKGQWRQNIKQKLALHWPPGRKEWIVLAVALLLIGGGIALFAMTYQPAPLPKPVHQAKKVVPPPAPTTVASTLSGLQVDPAVNARPVTGVMIENSLDARPQASLGQASVVFEAIAEGGITRFLALYQDTAPENIGPVRSARPYYIQWALGFDAAYAHVGGSPEALADVKNWGVRDLDQFANGGSYHRISERAAPHNVYTSIATLNQLETAKGYATSTFTGFARKPAPVTPPKATTSKKKTAAKAAPAPAPTAKSVNFAISGPSFNVHYDYVAATNSYNRSEGGAPHIDANTNTQISPTVVIALVMPYGIKSDGQHSDYQTIGSGAAYVFQDGGVTIGQWSKATDRTQFSFTDAAGQPLLLNPGQTWLTALGNPTAISYAP